MIPPNYSFFWGLVCVVPLKIGFVTFTFSPKRNVKMLFFLQINRCCCGFFLTMLPYRVIFNALLFPFTLSQSIDPLSSLPPYKDCSSQCSRKGWSLSPSPSSSPPHIASSRPPARSTLKSEKCQLAEKVLENFFRRRRVMTIESDNQWRATWASAVEKLYNLWKFANLFFSASNGRASSIKTW